MWELQGNTIYESDDELLAKGKKALCHSSGRGVKGENR